MDSSRVLVATSEWKPLVAIRTGYATLLPLILLQGIAIAFAAMLGLVLEAEQARSLRDLLYYVHTFVLSLLPALSVITIAYHAANLYGSNRSYSVALSLFVYLLLILTLDENAGYRINEVTLLGNLYSLIVGPAVPWALARLERIAMLRLFRSPQQNAYIRRFLNYVLPTIFIVAGALFAGSFVRGPFGVSALTAWHTNPQWTDSFPGLAVYVVALNALWTIGIHGTVALGPWVKDLHDNFGANAVAEAAGQTAPHLFPAPAFHAFVHLGGSGTTLALALAVFLVARSRTKRLVCLSASPVLFFNVNELVIYGLPVIFNRYLIVPFVLAPLVAMTTAYLAISQGIVPIPTVSPGWTTPPLVGAWLATEGSWAAVALAAFNLTVATAIYIPFVRRWEASQQAIGNSVLEFKDRFRFDSDLRTTHIEQDQLSEPLKDDSELRDALALLREGTLCSYYQPIVRVSDGRITGVESLLRLKHPTRGVQSPRFLGALKRAHLAVEIDSWVIDHLVKEWRDWDMERFAIPNIHINIHPESLLSPHIVERIIEAGRVLPIAVEVIEDEIPADMDRFLTMITLLQRNGIGLALDDFGVGHSSLSRLANLGISHLKIDKSMLDTAFEQPRGRRLLEGVIEFAKNLELIVCVEGVERMEQLELLRARGVDQAQGYLLGRPMPWDEMRRLVESGRTLPVPAEPTPGP